MKVTRYGHVAVLLIFYLNTLLMLLAMVWMTGDLAERRQRAQQAADAAAHTSSLWMARTGNALTASNVLQIRNASARVLMAAAVPTILETGKNLEPHIELAIEFGWLCPEYAAEVAFEVACLINFTREVAPALASYLDLREEAVALHEMQCALIDRFPEVVEEERLALETEYRCEIQLAQPSGGGRLRAPFESAGMARYRAILPLYEQVRRDRQGWLDDSMGIGRVYLGSGSDVWTHWTDRMTAAVIWDMPHVVLATHSNGPAGVLFEASPALSDPLAPFRPTDEDTERYFTVLAAAGASDDRGIGLLFSDQFGAVPRVSAIAQAEMFNLAEAHPTQAYSPHPWRMFTLKGWNWLPRLTLTRSLPATLKDNDRFQRLLDTWLEQNGESYVPLH